MEHYNCIYQHISPSGKSYIGMTKDFGFRHLTHSKRIKSGSKTKFYDAARKYGFDNFQIIILTENIEPYEKLKELEKYYIKLFNTYGDNSKGYNMTPGGGWYSTLWRTKWYVWKNTYR